PHGMKALGQAPSIHRRSTLIRYQFELTRIQIVSRWICYLGQLQHLPRRKLPSDPLRMVCFRSSALLFVYLFGNRKGGFIRLGQSQRSGTHDTVT
ncbi:hypothetical protein LZ30DRAFT_591159, partial [Colletotrichum cereale]